MPDAYSNDGLYWTSVLATALKNANAGYGVISGLLVAAQASPDMTVNVPSGIIGVATVQVSSAGNASLAINASHATLDRYDLVSVNSSGTVVYTAGTASATAVPPEIPATSVILAVVYVAAGATQIAAASIYDLRIQIFNIGIIPPIGTVMSWLKSYTNTPILPNSWVECNGQTLSDVESPYNGQVIPNLNNNNNFLRGNSTSGTTGGNLTHKHEWHHMVSASFAARNFLQINNPGFAGKAQLYDSNGNLFDMPGGAASYLQVSAYTNNVNNEPPYYNVVWIIKVK